MARIELVEKAKEAFIAKNYKEAYVLLKKITKESPEAAYYLGLMYYYGYYVSIDYNLAYSNFKQAWEGLFEEGIYMLGRMYEEGKGVDKNLEQAFKLYQAANHSENAKLRIANFYEYGKYVDKSLTSAIKIYNELQKNENAYAMYKIGAFYFSGEGLKKDLNNAYKWLNKALLAGSVEAMNYFRIIGTKSKTDVRSTSEIYNTGKSLVEKGLIEEALPYLNAAASEKYLPAIIQIYEIYKNGIVFEKDLVMAFKTLQKYESYKEAKIYYLMGRAYELGEGVDSSFVKAANYYELGASLDFEPAKTALREIRGY
ncbi:MAG: tetratricopeptide repeat protein [Candidatus Izemoplasmatales bacterium]|nr:tetratricopeptide repeat protein [Candidatus Izemoplasmatales bacterium]